MEKRWTSDLECQLFFEFLSAHLRRVTALTSTEGAFRATLPSDAADWLSARPNDWRRLPLWKGKSGGGRARRSDGDLFFRWLTLGGDRMPGAADWAMPEMAVGDCDGLAATTGGAFEAELSAGIQFSRLWVNDEYGAKRLGGAGASGGARLCLFGQTTRARRLLRAGRAQRLEALGVSSLMAAVCAGTRHAFDEDLARLADRLAGAAREDTSGRSWRWPRLARGLGLEGIEASRIMEAGRLAYCALQREQALDEGGAARRATFGAFFNQFPASLTR